MAYNVKRWLVLLAEKEGQRTRPVRRAWAWLGIHVLSRLKTVSSNVPAPPAKLWEDRQAALTPLQQTTATLAAEAVMNDLRQAISGKDAFFAAGTVVPEAWLALIRRSIGAESDMDAVYQSLGEQAPHEKMRG